MRVELWLKETSQPIEFDDVKNVYQKGSFYCIYVEEIDTVWKYPIENIFRVVESYSQQPKPNKEEMKN